MDCKVCKGPVPRYNRPTSEYCSKKCQATVEGYCELWEKKLAGTTAWRPMALDGIMHIKASTPVTIFSDVHCPMQSPEWVAQGLRCAEKLGSRHLILNGDFLDMNQISRHAGSYYRRKSELEDDFKAAEGLIDIFCERFDHVYFLVGNHSARIMQRMGGELTMQRMAKMMGSHQNFHVTSRSFVKVNKDVLVIHPRQYSRTRSHMAQKIAQRWRKHVLLGHLHHSATAMSPDAQWQAVEVGCMADVELFDYVRNEVNDMPDPVQGFAMIFGEKIVAFDKFSPWQLYGLPELDSPLEIQVESSPSE